MGEASFCGECSVLVSGAFPVCGGHGASSARSVSHPLNFILKCNENFTLCSVTCLIFLT